MMRMRLRNVVWITGMVLAMAGWGCSGPSEKVLSQYQSVLTLKPAKGYVKKVAMVQAPVPGAGFARQAGDLYFKALTTAIQGASSELQLLTADGAGLPDFMAALPLSADPVNAATLANDGRQGGFNGLITTAVRNIHAVVGKSGIWWFRKTRYRLFFEVTLDLYDPFTGSKLISRLEEGSVKIDEAAYEDYKAGSVAGIEALDEALVELAEALGESVAETLQTQPWQTSVVRVEGSRLFLSAGRQAGLNIGQQLAVVSGRRSLKGLNGETFIVPGNIIGRVVIVAVSDQAAEATAVAPGGIEAGDIAVAIK
jgi:hypothetical protein